MTKIKVSDIEKKALSFNLRTSSELINSHYKELKDAGLENSDAVSHLITLVEKKLLINLKKRENITGSLEFKLLKQKPMLKKLKSKWARKRGLSFETMLKKRLNKVLDLGVIYRNHISKFEFQPYDLIYFRPHNTPVLIECKASGIKVSKKGDITLSANQRRYENYYKRMDIIDNFLLRSGSELYFCYRHDETESAYLVNSQLIKENLPNLFTRKVDLSEKDYFKIELDEDKSVDIEGLYSFLNYTLKPKVLK